MIYMELPYLPPTTNQAYFNLKGGHGRGLSDEAKSFKTNAKQIFAFVYGNDLKRVKSWVDGVSIIFEFVFTDLYNKSYGKVPGVPLFKTQDATNRVKLVEDCLQEVAGYNDAVHKNVLLVKSQGASEKTCIWLYDVLDPDDPVQQTIQRLPRGTIRGV